MVTSVVDHLAPDLPSGVFLFTRFWRVSCSERWRRRASGKSPVTISMVVAPRRRAYVCRWRRCAGHISANNRASPRFENRWGDCEYSVADHCKRG